MRREHADTWATEIHDECVKLRAAVLPKSTLGQAVTYTLNMWPKLRRCFDYAEVELSNNLAENSMRPIALGCRTGCTWAARSPDRRWPRFYRWWNLCRLDVPVKEYLLAVLPGMARRKLSEVALLTRPLGSVPKLTWVSRTDTVHHQRVAFPSSN